MKRYLSITAGMLLLALAGCSKETGPSGKVGESPISFDVAATGVETRAVGEISGDDVLQGKSIGVFAAYTGKLTYENTTVSPDYMYNQEVKYSSTSNVWEYSPVKYWPNAEDEYVSFFAYAPFEQTPAEGSTTGIIGMSRKVDLGDPWINFRLPAYENQVDLLYGQQRVAVSDGYVYKSWLDQQKANWGDAPMQFTFLHALACIGDTVSIRMSDALFAKIQNSVDVTINSVSIEYGNLTTKARLVLRAEGTPNWKEIISGELLCSRIIDSGALSGKVFSKGASANPGLIKLYEGKGLFYIPLRIAGQPLPQATITVNYTVDNGVGTFTDSVTATVPFVIADAGTKQDLVLTLNADFNLDADVVTASSGISMPGTITPEPGF